MKIKKNLYLIGITGNICSGKSHAAKYLGNKPNSYYENMDTIAHRVYDRDPILLNSYKHIFGNNNNKIFDNENTFNERLNRKNLGKIVFDNKKELDKLNSLIKPQIRTLLDIIVDKLERQLEKENKKAIMFIEGAIIIEGNFQNYFNEIWMTKANKEEIERRFLSRLKVENIQEYKSNILPKILSNQLSDEEKQKYCTEIIDTTCSFEEINIKYDILHNKLLKKLNLI